MWIWCHWKFLQNALLLFLSSFIFICQRFAIIYTFFISFSLLNLIIEQNIFTETFEMSCIFLLLHIFTQLVHIHTLFSVLGTIEWLLSFFRNEKNYHEIKQINKRIKNAFRLCFSSWGLAFYHPFSSVYSFHYWYYESSEKFRFLLKDIKLYFLSKALKLYFCEFFLN